MYASGLADTWHSLPRTMSTVTASRGATHRNNDMWTVSVSSNNFQSLDGISVTDDVVEDLWPILLDPGTEMMREARAWTMDTHHGSSYGRLLAFALPLAGALPFAAEEDMTVTETKGWRGCDWTRRVTDASVTVTECDLPRFLATPRAPHRPVCLA